MFDRFFTGGKLEKKVIEKIKNHIQNLCTAAECFRNALLTKDKDQIYCVIDLERDADSIRREIVSTIYEGAFLPFLRPNICRFIEIVDEAFDAIEDAAFEFRYLNLEIYKIIEQECLKVASINSSMCELLLIAFESLLTKGDLKEKNLAIRIYEKQVDDIKFDITEKLRKCEIVSFWDGKIISDFVSYLTKVSDLIEDASDYLYIIEVSLR